MMPRILLHLQFWAAVCRPSITSQGSPHGEAAGNGFPALVWHVPHSWGWEAGQCAVQGWGGSATACAGAPSQGQTLLWQARGWLGFPWRKQAAKSINVNHAPLPVFSPISLFFISVGFFILWNQQKRSYFPSVSETPSLFPDFPFHAVWILLRSLYTKAEYWLYDALRDLKGCCHNVTKLWGHFISTRSSLEDFV